MCPDIETYAPLISARFGLGEVDDDGHPAHRLRVQLADRSLTQTNPLLGVAAQLLDLAGSRATASQVLDLAETEPVRRRFRFTDDDLDIVTAWVRESGVRWAFDQDHRDPFGLAGYPQNTWRFGLDRVLAGVTMSADAHAWIDTTLPLDDVGSTRIELAGRFAEYVDRLLAATDRLDGARPLADWLDALRDGIDQLTRVGRDDGWQVGQVHREFAGVAAEAGTLAATSLTAARRPGAVVGPSGRAADPRQLPDRHVDRLHDGADALGAAPGGLPAGPRRRGVPTVRAGRRRRRTGQVARSPASATSAARTANSCSTRSSPPPSRW